VSICGFWVVGARCRRIGVICAHLQLHGFRAFCGAALRHAGDKMKEMPEVTGVVETCLYVDDLERSVRFYQDIFEFPRLIGDERFCALSVAGRSVLLLFRKGSTLAAMPVPGGIIPPHDGAGTLHLAFAIPAAAETAWRERLEQRGIAIESTVDWPRGGRSMYFRDPDQHLLELITPGCWSIY
jgi:catechol 2,3-dioxygenase-like lactoylglutathione lyase family enzyme